MDPKSWVGVVSFCHHISINFIPFVYQDIHQYPGSQRAGKEGQGGGMLLANPDVLSEATYNRKQSPQDLPEKHVHYSLLPNPGDRFQWYLSGESTNLPPTHGAALGADLPCPIGW